MNLRTVAPVVLSSFLACGVVTGCASNTAADDGATADDSAFTGSSGLEVSSAVGALVVDGKKLCTAALVDVDASARIGSVSAHGRQIVFGGACVGQLSNGNVGAAMFVTQANGVSLQSPIVAFDFQSQAAAGLAVGILGAPVPGATPLDTVGASALANAGVSTAQVFEADENGVIMGATVNVHAGVAFSLATQCSSFSFAASAGVTVGGGVALRDDGLGAAAFVRINGKLHFAAHIDGQCIADHFGDDIAHLGGDVLSSANDVMNALNSLGTGKVIAVVQNHGQEIIVKVKLEENVAAIRVNGQGHIHVQDGNGGVCEKFPLLGIVGGPCEVRPLDDSGYKKGQVITLKIDTNLNIVPVPQLVISTTNEPKTGSTDSTDDASRQGGG